ncbi:serine hydrolase [Fluviicola sp.]|uniref:serine hydrolase n=1 Tax=Fluviicola sp. TaxID=1917219 RepID=UPI0031E13DA1
MFSEKKCFNGDLLVAVNGQPVFERSEGFRDNTTKEIVQHNSIFNLGSVSKPFTALAILQLHQQGKLNIEDQVLKYIPEFPYPDIKIKHLLSHTSGLKQSLNQIEEVDLSIPVNNDSLVAIFERYKPTLFAEPGAEWIYSNVGYELLAVIVERVSLMRFAVYMDKYVFKPAGMKRTFIPSSQKITHWLPKGVQEQDLLVPHELKNSASCEASPVDSVNFVQQRKDFLVGSENVYSCVGDLSRFDCALRQNKLLSKELQELAYTPFILTSGDTAKDLGAPIPSYYGMGWFISISRNNGRVIWHKGRSYGSRSVFLRNPERKQVVAMTDNFDFPAVDLKGISLLRTINKEPYRNPVLMSLVQKLGCEIYSQGIECALVEFDHRKEKERADYYISEEEMILLSEYLVREKKMNEAKQVLNHSLQVFPRSPAIFSEYAKILLSEQSQEQATEYFKKAVSLNGESEEEKESLLNGVGYYYLGMNDYNAAEFVLKLNTELFSESGNVFDSYAYVLDQNNKINEAIEMEEKAVMLAAEKNDALLETFRENLKNLRAKKHD